MVLKKLHLQPNSLGHHHIVVIHAGDVFTPGYFHACVPRSDNPDMRQFHHAHTRVPFGVFLQDVARTVGRFIIDGDKLEIAKCLRQNTFHGLGQIPLGIVDRKDNRYLWKVDFRHGPAASSRNLLRFIRCIIFIGCGNLPGFHSPRWERQHIVDIPKT